MEYGYLKRLIDEKKNKFGFNCSISSKMNSSCITIIIYGTHGCGHGFPAVSSSMRDSHRGGTGPALVAAVAVAGHPSLVIHVPLPPNPAPAKLHADT